MQPWLLLGRHGSSSCCCRVAMIMDAPLAGQCALVLLLPFLVGRPLQSGLLLSGGSLGRGFHPRVPLAGC